jgi:hypothetical protein
MLRGGGSLWHAETEAAGRAFQPQTPPRRILLPILILILLLSPLLFLFLFPIRFPPSTGGRLGRFLFSFPALGDERPPDHPGSPPSDGPTSASRTQSDHPGSSPSDGATSPGGRSSPSAGKSNRIERMIPFPSEGIGKWVRRAGLASHRISTGSRVWSGPPCRPDQAWRNRWSAIACRLSRITESWIDSMAD